MIFDRDEDLRGCTVRLRNMGPGESVTIPMDADRLERTSYDALYTRYDWGCGELRRVAFHCRSGREPYGHDIVEVLRRPEPETRKPSNKELTVKTTTTYKAGVMHLVAHTADGVTGYTVEASPLGSLSSMDIDELRQLCDVIDAALSDAEGKA